MISVSERIERAASIKSLAAKLDFIADRISDAEEESTVQLSIMLEATSQSIHTEALLYAQDVTD